jgi:hypothetical protein
MRRRWPLYSLILGVSLLCALSLSGCDFLDSLAKFFRIKEDANAQSTQLVNFPVQTVSIRAGTFSIETDNAITLETNVEIREDGTTVYRQITGSAHFTLENNNSASTVNLTPDSVIIERPTGTLLIV